MSLNLAEPRVGDWLAQFEPTDQLTARCLLENISAVSADDFTVSGAPAPFLYLVSWA
jgi:hypothetical protein